VSEWAEMTLGEVMGLDIDAVEVRPDASYEIVGVLNRGRGLLYRDPISGTATSYKTLNRISPGQVVYSRLKAFEGSITVAPAALGSAYASQEFPTFTCSERLLPGYFALLTTMPRLWATLQNLSTGMGGRRERVKPGDFLTIRVTLPPPATQQRIVHVMAAVDAHVEALADEISKADAVWWALAAEMTEALKGAETARLDSVAEISGGLTKNRKDFEEPDLVEVPYLRVANVLRRRLDLREVAAIKTTRAKAQALRLLPGDVLFNEGGDKDKLGRGDVWKGQIEDCIHQNHVFRARITSPDFEPRFVSAWGNTFGRRWFETYGTQTTGIASINKATLSRFPVPQVPLDVQRAWADRLDSVVAAHETLSGELADLRLFRSTLLSALISRETEIPDSYGAFLEAVS
jgi:type I restriction enzyme, S subunit